MTGRLTSREREKLGQELYALRAPAVALARRVLGAEPAAEDACAEAYVRALSRIDELPALRELRPWFLRVVLNAARSLGRSDAARRRREEAVMPEPRSESPAEAAERRELAAAASAALQELEENLRLPLALHYEQGLSHAEVAAVLEAPAGTVAGDISRGLSALRERLARRGFAAVPAAALAGALGAGGAMPVPAGLSAKIGSLIAGRLGTGTAAAGTATAKGGLAMKIVVGVVLAGALAGVAALFFGPPTAHRLPPTDLASPPAPAKGKPVKEHFAFCNTAGYLDGPRRQAMSGGRVNAMDSKGNAYNVGLRSMCALRVARVDGMVETIGGDNRWSPPLSLEEGPAAWLPNVGNYGGIGQGSASFVARGLPLEGPDKGCLYACAGLNTGHPDWIYKVWKNKDKGDRWWFKHVMGGGSAAPPSAVGQSAPALGLKLSPSLSMGEDGKVYVLSNGSLYRYDEEKNELACVLAVSDYVGKMDKWDWRPNRPGGAERIIPALDGSFFLGYYNASYPIGLIYRVSADRGKVEKIAQGSGRDAGRQDGPAMGSAWFGGPLLREYYPPDLTFSGAIDDCLLRRCKDGRISTFCKDGEWREIAKYTGEFNARADANIKDDQPVPWGRGWARVGNDTIYQFYWLATNSTAIYRIHPVDFGKPTVGPLVEGK